MRLEEKLQETFVELNVRPRDMETLRSFLQILKDKHEPTYEHSIRVGLLGADAAEYLGLNRKALLFAGLLHDEGKSLVPIEALTKKGRLNEEDWERIHQHPNDGYRLVKDIFRIAAEIGVRHHYNEGRGYPKTLPQLEEPFPANLKGMIEESGKLLAIVDFYDAATTRVSENGDTPLSGDEARPFLLEKFPESEQIIEKLYEGGIF